MYKKKSRGKRKEMIDMSREDFRAIGITTKNYLRSN